MKTGMTQQELVIELERQRHEKGDYIAPTNLVEMYHTTDGGVELMLKEKGNFQVADVAHHQIGERVGIPGRYYNRMLQEAPGLLAENVNHWFEANPERRLLRTLDGRVRAFLSDSYRPLDHWDLAQAILPVLPQTGARLDSCQVTETHLYLKAVLHKRRVTIPAPVAGRPSITLTPAIVIRNSEVGLSTLTIMPAVHDLSCLNIAPWAKKALRQRHVGRRSVIEEAEEVLRHYSSRTRELDDAALFSKVKDIAVGALDGPVFEEMVEEVRRASNSAPLTHVVESVQLLAKEHDLTKDDENGVLRFLIEGGDLSQWGLSSAVTRHSQEVESYDHASELETLGGEIITLPQGQWEKLVNAR